MNGHDTFARMPGYQYPHVNQNVADKCKGSRVEALFLRRILVFSRVVHPVTRDLSRDHLLKLLADCVAAAGKVHGVDRLAGQLGLEVLVKERDHLVGRATQPHEVNLLDKQR